MLNPFPGKQALVRQCLYATSQSDKQILIALFNNTFGLHAPIDELGNTFLHFIIRTSSLETIRYVLTYYQVDLNCQNMFGETPLYQAANMQRTKVVALLKSIGADPEIKDILGIGPSDLCDETGMYLRAEEIPAYTFACEQIKEIKDAAGFEKFVQALNDNGYGLHTAIDSEGNTILHHLAMKASHQVWSILLTLLRPEFFDVKNDFECTPLIMALLKSRFTIASAMLYHGVGLPTQNEVLLAMVEKGLFNRFKLCPKSIQKYLSANKMLASSLNIFRIEEAVSTLLQMGFMLDEPILENDGSLLHWLVLNAPYGVVERAVQTQRYSTLDPQDRFGETPFMWAARDGRQKVVSLFYSKGASTTIIDDLGLTANEHALTYPHPVQFIPQSAPTQTIAQHMMQWIKPRLKGFELLTNQQKCEQLFNLYTTYIKEQKWPYKGVPDDLGRVIDRVLPYSYIFDCTVGTVPSVNCFDLARGFGYLLKTLGFKDISLHIYENNIYSKPFTPKNPRIKGDYVCFDPVAHQAMVSDGNNYKFLQHCVVKCLGVYYDPTFCCYYTKADDINLLVATPPPSPLPMLEPQEKSVPPLRDKSFSFHSNFVRALEKIFLTAQWDIVQRKGKLIIKSKNNQSQLTLFIENDLLTFGDKKGISEHTLVKVGVAWKQSLPKPLQSFYSVLTPKGSNWKVASKDSLDLESVASPFNESAKSPVPAY